MGLVRQSGSDEDVNHGADLDLPALPDYERDHHQTRPTPSQAVASDRPMREVPRPTEDTARTKRQDDTAMKLTGKISWFGGERRHLLR